MKKSKKSEFAGLAVLAAAALAAVLLFSKITVYCDDYWYGTFFRGGLSRFWELTRWHYLNFNGRAFVHFAAELVIWADKYIYMLLAPAMLVTVFFLGLRLQGGVRRPGPALACVGACTAAVLALPVRFLNQSLLWMSAGFNYLFPLTFILITLRVLRRGLEKGKPDPALWLLIFLSGATTEQNGLAAFVILGGFTALAWLRRKTSFRNAFFVCLLCGIGYLTVILAPGTWVRVGNETGGGILQVLHPRVLAGRLAMSLAFFTGEFGLPWLFTLFSALTGLHALLTDRAPRVLSAGLGAAVLYPALWFGGHPFAAACLSVLWILIAAVLYLLRQETAVRGLLLGGALAILLVMVFTTTASERTTVPAILLLIAVCGSLACECLEKAPVWAGLSAFGAVMAALLVLALPTFRGYAKNSVIWEKNARELRSRGGVIVLSMGADRRYGHTTYFDSTSYLENAMYYYGVTGEKITYESPERFAAGAYGTDRAGLPIMDNGGTLYVPIQDSLLLVGGESEWSFSMTGTWCRLDGHEYILRPNGEIIPFDSETGTVTGEISRTTVWSPIYTFYAPMDVMSELFGIEWDYNEAENIYYLKKES